MNEELRMKKTARQQDCETARLYKMKNEKWRINNYFKRKNYSLFIINYKFKHAVAFTLAEVLITLGIIGVVAAMTMPVLINKINDRQHIAALKKSYSMLSQATVSIVGEYGSLANLCGANDNDCLRDIYKKYVKTIKTCNKGNNEGNCWVLQDEWKRMNGDAAWSHNGASGLVLNDGIFVNFGYEAPECNYLDGTQELPVTFAICGSMMIDVNGKKGPNIIGKDIFGFYIAKNRLVPFGTEGTWTGTDRFYRCEEGGDGEACAAEYLGNLKVKFKN